MNTIEAKSLEILRRKGYAVIVWTPSELRGVDPRDVEDQSCAAGHRIIEDLADGTEDEEGL